MMFKKAFYALAVVVVNKNMSKESKLKRFKIKVNIINFKFFLEIKSHLLHDISLKSLFHTIQYERTQAKKINFGDEFFHSCTIYKVLVCCIDLMR
jgi:hypothetical protein